MFGRRIFQRDSRISMGTNCARLGDLLPYINVRHTLLASASRQEDWYSVSYSLIEIGGVMELLNEWSIMVKSSSCMVALMTWLTITKVYTKNKIDYVKHWIQ